MSNDETIQALHSILMKAPDAQYDGEGTGMWWCTIDGCDGSDHGLADYILDAIAAGKIPGLWTRGQAIAFANVQCEAPDKDVERLTMERDAARQSIAAQIGTTLEVKAERDSLRAALGEALDELGKHKISEDGEYNNGDVIDLCEKIDALLGVAP